jgi:transporter family-2 protein
MREALWMAMALVMGAVLPLQAMINANLRAGLATTATVATLVSFAGGTLVLALVALLQPGGLQPLAGLARQPAWTLLGGPLGAAFLFGMTFLAPRLGLTALLSLVIAGQLLASIGIDHVGLGAITEQRASLNKLIGALLVVAGVVVLNLDRR